MTQRRCSKCGSETIKWKKMPFLVYICHKCGFRWQAGSEVYKPDQEDYNEYCPKTSECLVIRAYKEAHRDLLTALMMEDEGALKNKIANLYIKINRQKDQLRICEHCKYSNASRILHLEKRLKRLRNYYKYYRKNSIETRPYGSNS